MLWPACLTSGESDLQDAVFSNQQVINAALTLAARPQSKVAQDNMDVFKDQWEKQVRVLTEAVDDITSVDDFLSVSGNHLQASSQRAGGS